MSFHDFITTLNDGGYSRPISKNSKGEAFCEQVMFPDDVAAKVTDLKTFDENVSKLKNIRIRQVTGGGSFSSGTKAKFKLSLPIRARYVSQLRRSNPPVRKLAAWPWRWEITQGAETNTPIEGELTISTMTMYHPSPLRIENVQHDAVLSLNDPSDRNAEVVVLIPLKSSNNAADDSVGFFGKIAKHLPGIMTPDSVTGLYTETNIPTGNDWNIKQVFWLDTPGADNVAKVTDAYYTWMGAGTYSRTELSRSPTVIHYGWKPEGKQVRYFMLQTPVSISSTDLSLLTRSLPPTPAEEAIHQIPDPGTGSNPKILYKKATGPGAGAACGVVRERMTNPGQGEILASLFSGGGASDMLVGADGTPLIDTDSCNPFAANAKKALSNPSPFTPTKMAALFFNFMILIALAVGAWLAMFFVVNKDYDYSFRDFSKDAGKVIGKLALQTSGRIKDTTYSVGQSLPSFGKKPDAADAAPAISAEDLPKGVPPGLMKVASMFGKKTA